MKLSKSDVYSKTHAIPSLQFEDQKLTSFSGLVVFQKLFDHLSLKKTLQKCFTHRRVRPIFGEASIVLLLVVHLLLGYRELRHLKFYHDDPMVKRLLGLKRLPDVATISRTLSNLDAQSVNNYQNVAQNIVLNRIQSLALSRVTLDFDGSVLSTGRFAQGVAVGFNKKKKGQRSYYPLLCTVAQTGQVFDVLHRSGNVHDSNGAQEFINQCVARVQEVLPNVNVEVRMDSAFFSEALVTELEALGIDFSISVPFERMLVLKEQVEARRRWIETDEHCDHFELQWKPKSWKSKKRFVVIRQASKISFKGPVQLDIFQPSDYQWEYKVILTNKTLSVKKLMAYHNGRGSQESIFAELKSHCQMDYVPTRTWHGNQVYLLSAVMAHNLSRELQMVSECPQRSTMQKRPALWEFKKLETLRKEIIRRAGRIIRPQGKLVLSMSENDSVKQEMLHFLSKIEQAA